MSIEEDLLEKLRALPQDQQREVLKFAASLKVRNCVGSRRSLRGVWKGFKFSITEKDIAQVRGEMWGNFPRDVA